MYAKTIETVVVGLS